MARFHPYAPIIFALYDIHIFPKTIDAFSTKYIKLIDSSTRPNRPLQYTNCLFLPIVGRYCEYRDRGTPKSPEDYATFAKYAETLQLWCDQGPSAGTFTWTPDQDTPDLVYYQVHLLLLILYIYIYICIYVYICICIYICIYMYMYIYVYIYVYHEN